MGVKGGEKMTLKRNPTRKIKVYIKEKTAVYKIKGL